MREPVHEANRDHDKIHTAIKVSLSVVDRLRILLSGELTVRTVTCVAMPAVPVCGTTSSVSVLSPLWRLRRRGMMAGEVVALEAPKSEPLPGTVPCDACGTVDCPTMRALPDLTIEARRAQMIVDDQGCLNRQASHQ